MNRIHFNEVVTRDGFQIEPGFVPTDVKVALVDELSACGYAKIEVTSFTSAKAIPMLRDAEEVMGRADGAGCLLFRRCHDNGLSGSERFTMEPVVFGN